MAGPTILPNLIAGNKSSVDLGIQNLGIKPVGNGAGSQQPGPSGLGSGGKVGGATPVPVTTGPTSLLPTSGPPALPPVTTGTVDPNPVTSSPVTSLLPTNGVDPSSSIPTGTSTDSSPANGLDFNTAKLDKQLNSEYGKGVGSVIDSLIKSIGSGDDAYMQAYDKAMAQPNAEALATLSTNLGNEGISGDSSTAAIAKADLLSGEVSQEGLQVQQLKMNDLAELLGLTQGLEGQASKDAADTGWSEFGHVIGDIGGAISNAI